MRVHKNASGDFIDPDGNVLTPVSKIATKKEAEALEAEGILTVEQVADTPLKTLTAIEGVGEATAKKLRDKARNDDEEEAPASE